MRLMYDVLIRVHNLHADVFCAARTGLLQKFTDIIESLLEIHGNFLEICRARTQWTSGFSEPLSSKSPEWTR